MLGKNFKINEGVQCETCHGAGSGYKTNSTMKDQAKAIAKGLIIPNEKLCKESELAFRCSDYHYPGFFSG